MASAQTAEITRLLRAWTHGNQEALNQVTPIVYDELHRITKGYLRREKSGQTLQPTSLVHETYLRLVDAAKVDWQDRAHFFGGLSVQETAEVLSISPQCVMRGWKLDKAFLMR